MKGSDESPEPSVDESAVAAAAGLPGERTGNRRLCLVNPATACDAEFTTKLDCVEASPAASC